MQIPEMNWFWLLAGAFVAAGATWVLDGILIKRKLADATDDVKLASLQEKARMVEPLNQQLQFSRSQVQELENKLKLQGERHSPEFDVAPYTARIDELSAQLEAVQSEKAEMMTMLSSAESGAGQAVELLNSLNLLKQELAAKETETGEMVVSMSQLKNENEALRQGAATLTPEIESLKEKLSQAENDAIGAKHSLNELKGRFESLQSEGSTTEPELQSLRVRVADAEAVAESLKATLTDVQGQLAQAREIPDLRQEVEQLRSDLAEAQAEKESLVAVQEERSSSDHALQQRIAELETDLARAQEAGTSHAESLRAQIVELTSKLETLDAEAEAVKRESDDLREQFASYDEVQSELERLRSKVPGLETAVTERDELALNVGRLEKQLLEQDEVIENFKAIAARAASESATHSSASEIITSLEAEVDAKNAELERLGRRTPELEALVNELREELEEKASRIEKLEAVAGSVEAVGSEAGELRALVQDLSAQLEQAKRESQEIRTALVKVQAEAEILRESTSHLETVKSENIRLQNFVESNEDSVHEIAPLRMRINELFGSLEESNRENEGNRKALQATMDELRRLRQDMGELSRLREENASLRAMKHVDAAPREFETLKLRINDVATQLDQTKTEAYDAREQLAVANREISRLRAELTESSEMGELS